MRSNQLQSSYNIQPPSISFSSDKIQLRNSSLSPIYSQYNRYKVYRHIPIPSYSNNAPIQVYDNKNLNNQQQLKRERYRRSMIDRMFIIFDEDGSLFQHFILIKLCLSFNISL